MKAILTTALAMAWIGSGLALCVLVDIDIHRDCDGAKLGNGDYILITAIAPLLVSAGATADLVRPRDHSQYVTNCSSYGGVNKP